MSLSLRAVGPPLLAAVAFIWETPSPSLTDARVLPLPQTWTSQQQPLLQHMQQGQLSPCPSRPRPLALHCIQSRGRRAALSRPEASLEKSRRSSPAIRLRSCCRSLLPYRIVAFFFMLLTASLLCSSLAKNLPWARRAAGEDPRDSSSSSTNKKSSSSDGSSSRNNSEMEQAEASVPARSFVLQHLLRRAGAPTAHQPLPDWAPITFRLGGLSIPLRARRVRLDTFM